MRLDLKPPQLSAVADGPISLELSLTNDSASPVDVPVPKQSEPFEYTIFDSEGERTISIASSAHREASIPSLEPVPELPAPQQSLEPNAVLPYKDDLTSLLPAPLPSGRYVVEGLYRQPDGSVARSERVSIEVKPSLPVAIAQTLDPRPESLILVDFHDTQDGSLLLRKRQSDHTLLGRFYDMLRFRRSAPVQQAAIAVEANFDTPRYWRWVAWLEGNSIRAGVVRAVDFVGPSDAIPLDLEDPRLLHHGYVFPDGSGKFIVAGKGKMQLVTIGPARGSKPEVVDIQLTNAPLSVPFVTLAWNESESPELIFTWNEDKEILQARIDPRTGLERSSVSSIFTTNRDMVEVAGPPAILPGRTGRVQILLAPANEDDRYILTSLDVADPASQTSRRVPLLGTLPGESVDRWVLPSHAYPEAPVLALSKGEFWVTDRDGWRHIAVGDPLPGSTRLWTFDSTTFQCTWFDTVRGYQSVFLRPGR